MKNYKKFADIICKILENRELSVYHPSHDSHAKKRKKKSLCLENAYKLEQTTGWLE